MERSIFMKSKNEIDMNFLMVDRKADELHEIAVELRKMAEDNNDGIIEYISHCWKGRSSEMYCAKVGKAGEKLLKSAMALENIAEAVKTISSRTYKAESEACEIAVERLYDK